MLHVRGQACAWNVQTVCACILLSVACTVVCCLATLPSSGYDVSTKSYVCRYIEACNIEAYFNSLRVRMNDPGGIDALLTAVSTFFYQIAAVRFLDTPCRSL